MALFDQASLFTQLFPVAHLSLNEIHARMTALLHEEKQKKKICIIGRVAKKHMEDNSRGEAMACLETGSAVWVAQGQEHGPPLRQHWPVLHLVAIPSSAS